jgi:hypothetical protein
MKTYLISYDLGVPETSADYQKVINRIKNYSSWATPLKSQWLVNSTKTAKQVRDDITPLVDSNDEILVIDVTGADWASWNIDKEVTDWMQNNM